jgi:GTPase SAR1 family protein
MTNPDPDPIPLDDADAIPLDNEPSLPSTDLGPPPSLPEPGSLAAPEMLGLVGDAPPPRDRVVVVGRTQAGKTVYVARLYEQLWNSRSGEVHMRALSGPPHVKFMQIISSMRDGHWPDATGGKDYIDVEVTFARRKFRMTLLDYPGETFSKAFVMGQTDAEDTRDLVEHIDRAAGVILLIDPQNAVESRDQAKRADDDFGMQQVLHRIRSFPSGENVPVAIVLTKTDLRKALVQSLGGLENFARTYLSNLLRPAGKVSKLFRCVAVWSRASSRTGKAVPDLDREPVNLVEPLVWVLKKMIEIEAAGQVREETDRQTSQMEQLATEALQAAQDESAPMQDRIMRASSKIAAATAVGGASHPNIAQATEIVQHLRDRLERRAERNFWIVLGLSLAIVAAGALWLTLRYVASQQGSASSTNVPAAGTRTP